MDHRDTAAVPQNAGPRQEYLDAFDEGPFEPRVPEQRRAEPEGPPPHRRHGRPARRRPVRGDSRGHRRAKGGWGRTLTGIGAAAVVTALGVVLAVRMVDPDAGEREVSDAAKPAPGTEERREDGPPPPEAGERPAPTEPSTPPEPTYEELLGTMFEMDPELAGSGELVPVGGTAEAADAGATTELRYRVDVEDRLGLDPELFAEAVHRTLNDERGWTNDGERSFSRVSAGEYDFIVTLASPGTTADWCARSNLDVTEDNVSCNSSSTERVMINAWRWAQGAETFGEDIAGYRQMLINHEVGHRLGYGHVTCPGEGALAPVMMQQTKFLETNGVTCRPNPWPHPDN